MFIKYFVKNINISFILLIIGSIIGAGFSSGKEISVFFSGSGKYSYVIIILITFLLYIIVKELIYFGNRTKVSSVKEINKILFNKKSGIFDFFILIGIFIFLTAMIAGLNSIGKLIFSNINFPILTIISIFFCQFICEIGYFAIKKVNNILMPIVVLFIIFVGFYNIFFVKNFPNNFIENPSIIKFLLLGCCYIAYNIIFSSSIIIEGSKDFSISQTKKNALVFSLILGSLILLINAALLKSSLSTSLSDLPMLNMAFNINNIIGVIFSLVLWFSILTSLITSLYILVNSFKINHLLSSSIILSLAFICSLFGFNYIVNYIYPIQGIIGVIILIKIFIFNKKNKYNSKNFV